MTRPEFEKLVEEYGNASFYHGALPWRERKDKDAVDRCAKAKTALLAAFDAFIGNKVQE